jgi:glycosyltransferase involved in cell wall biosynthesis
MKLAFVFGKALPYRTAFFHTLSQKYDIDFFLTNMDESHSIREPPLRYLRYHCLSLPFLTHYGSYGYDHPSLPITLGFQLVKKKYDVIISKGIGTAATYISFLVSKILRKPFILWDETWYYPPTLARTIVMPLFQRIAKGADAIIVPGSKAQEFFISLNVNRNRLFIAPNACEKQVVNLQNLATQKKMLKLENQRVVLYFGRLIKRKGCQFLLKAFAQLQNEFNDATLIIAGDGPYKNALKDLCKILKVTNVHFLGYVKEEDKAAIHSLAQVLIVPSIRTPMTAEIWGIVLNEAMSLGKPVIATDAVGAAYDLIEEGINGFIIKERDVPSLYRAISKILSNEEQSVRMGLSSKEMITTKFSMKNMVYGFVQTIAYVLKDRT